MQLRILSQQLKIGHAITITGENDLPGIPPLGNMMRHIDDHDACKSCHNQNYQR
jgi:hypothetical protein